MYNDSFTMRIFIRQQLCLNKRQGFVFIYYFFVYYLFARVLVYDLQTNK